MGQSESTPSTSQSWVTIIKKPGRGNLTDADLKSIEDAYLGAFNLEDKNEPLHYLNQEQDEPSAAVPMYLPVDKMLADKDFFSTQLAPPSEYLETGEDVLHPILHFANFDTSLLGEAKARQAWQEMGPALSIASQWLSAPEARKNFWHRLLFGIPSFDSEADKSYLAPSPLESDFRAANENSSLKLSRLVGNVRFYWSPSSMPYGGNSIFQGVCAHNLNSVINGLDAAFSKDLWDRSDVDARKYLTSYAPRIGLSTTFLYHLLRPALRRHDRCADMRYQLTIAKTLCHELCHALYGSRDIVPKKEPHVFLSDQTSEVGLSWDFFLSGTRFELMCGVEHIGRLDARTWQYMLSYPSIAVPVPMEWVELWFRKSTWTAGREDFRTNTLWGKGPGVVGVPVPELFVAHRYSSSKVAGEPGLFKEVLYINRKVEAPFLAKGKVDEPPDGVELQDWYAKVSSLDVEKAKTEGFDVKKLSGALGGYEQRLNG
ncbi:hypothetical protein PMIN06_005267 [Paraphaeosphaeria minitans]|uniref:Uncharacterized protein n=1 Tax=Paraphaeosphaeria minitans TaxID=565426 RepID=A0A9P6GP31_9PLEO|nr:hypothetical protein PMIN01_01876 [Paraphaeosphaeria minitans]